MAIIHQIRKNEAANNRVTVEKLKDIAPKLPLSPPKIVENSAARIALEMARIHGGEWHSQIDHQRRLVMVWCVD